MENNKASLESTNNPIYKDFFFKNDFIQKLVQKQKIHPTIWRDRESVNSFSIRNRSTEKNKKPIICRILQETFGIENEHLFKIKYEEATSGEGQEWKRITTLHSSSLIALLCFYSVSEKHLLSIGDYIFNESFFEVKTIVKDNHKSNMDIVLRGFNNKTGKKAVLFLESKFTEYLNCGKKGDISIDAYKDEYEGLSLFDRPLGKTLFSQDDKGICINAENPRKTPIYCGGIKQMLSHYIGVGNYATQKSAEHSIFKYADNEDILLGEIMFDFQEAIRRSSDKLENYKKVYSELAERINRHQCHLKMIDRVMTYQQIFIEDNPNFIKEENTKQFYNL